MQYKDTRSMAYAIRDELDKCISKSISMEKCADFIKDIFLCEQNKRKLFRAKGLSSTVETVLGKDRLSLFIIILKDLGYNI